MLKAGDKAPAWKLQGDDGNTHSLKEFNNNSLILYFYPKDATPGCTIEACDFRVHRASLEKKGYAVVGVSPDSVDSHQKWQAKQRFGFLLLSDPEHKVADAYGAWGDKVLYGKKYKGIIRSTFVVDKTGTIVSAEYSVSPKGHAAAMLNQLNERSMAREDAENAALTKAAAKASAKTAKATPAKAPAAKATKTKPAAKKARA